MNDKQIREAQAIAYAWGRNDQGADYIGATIFAIVSLEMWLIGYREVWETIQADLTDLRRWYPKCYLSTEWNDNTESIVIRDMVDDQSRTFPSYASIHLLVDMIKTTAIKVELVEWYDGILDQFMK